MIHRFWIATMLLLSFVACTSEGGSEPDRLSLVKISGDNQSGTVGQPIASAVQVRATNQDGRAIANIGVAFEVVSGGGTIASTTQTTNSDGIASPGSWTLGPRPGENRIRAEIMGENGTAITFTATAATGPFAIITKVVGDEQSGTAGQALVTKPRVLATDSLDNPVAGVPILFEVIGGGGSVTGASTATGTDGTAEVGAWVLGPTAGPNTLTATATPEAASGSASSDPEARNTNPVVFTATGTAGAAAQIEAVDGGSQTALVGTEVPIPPIVRATDMFGNSVAGVPVEFEVTAGGGIATGTSTMTSSSGLASVLGWTLGPTPGPNTLTATAQGTGIAGNPIVFDATAQAIFNVQQYAGTWTGTWVNNTFASTGTNTLTIAVDTSAQTVSLTFSTTGSALGQNGVPQQTRMSAFDDTGLMASVTVNVYGDVTMTVDADGVISANGVNLGPGFDRWDATGTITATQLVLDWTVTFTAGGTANGRTTLTRQ